LQFNKQSIFLVNQWEDSLNEKYPHVVYEEHCKANDDEQCEPPSIENKGSDKLEGS
jgi:hypothetical protein